MPSLYQHVSDWIPGTPTPFSGVIRVADGKFIPCEANNQDWADYLAWAATEGNVTDPYLSPAAGGVVVVVPEGEEPVGTMNDSLPPPAEGGPPVMVDVPYVSGSGVVGEELACTMGNWDGEPRSYGFLWVSQLASEAPLEVGTGDKYVVAETDVGRTLFCTVTATNAAGSTRAPVSNGVMAVAAAVAVTETAPASAPMGRDPRDAHHDARRPPDAPRSHHKKEE
jgi:hypothetical protein